MSEKSKKNHILDYDINEFNAPFYLLKFHYEIKSGKATAMTYRCLSFIYSMYSMNKLAFKYALKSIRLDNSNPYAWYAVGVSRQQYSNDYSKSKKYFLKAFELGGDDFYALLYELIICVVEESNCLMRDKYEKMFLNINSDDSGYFLRRAYIYEGHCRLKEAFADYSIAIKARIFNHNKTDPDLCSFILVLLTLVRSSLYRLLMPGSAESFEAAFLLDTGHEKEGVDLMLEAASKAKKQADRETCYKSLLDYFCDKEEYKKCIDAANRILIKDKYVEAYCYKAFSYRQLGDFKRAREALYFAHEYSSEEDFKTSTYYSNLALTYFEEGDYGKAINFLNKQIVISPSAHPFLYKGFCLEELNEFDDAIKSYNKSLEYKADELAYYRVANLYYEKNDYENALISINQGLLLNKDADNYTLKGDILTAMKRIKEARFCYKLAEGLE